MSLLTDPTIQAALQAVNADQEQLSKDEASAKEATEKANVAARIAANSRQHFATDVQALYEAIEATTGIKPRAV